MLKRLLLWLGVGTYKHHIKWAHQCENWCEATYEQFMYQFYQHKYILDPNNKNCLSIAHGLSIPSGFTITYTGAMIKSLPWTCLGAHVIKFNGKGMILSKADYKKYRVFHKKQLSLAKNAGHKPDIWLVPSGFEQAMEIKTDE